MRGHAPRIVTPNDPAARAEAVQNHVTNRVRTTKYTLLTFLPKNLLLEQLTRAANVYFLVISVLSCLPTSAKDPTALIGTFSAVLAFTALKEAYEDWQRHLHDTRINTRLVRWAHRCCAPARPRAHAASPIWPGVCGSGWRVGGGAVAGGGGGGHCHGAGAPRWGRAAAWPRSPRRPCALQLRKDESVPADMLLLSCSDDKHGQCFLDTCSLDGETNLKPYGAVARCACRARARGGGRHAHARMAHSTNQLRTPEQLAGLRCSVHCEAPTPAVYSFTGFMRWPAGAEPAAVDSSQLLLRGCILRNTQCVQWRACCDAHGAVLTARCGGLRGQVGGRAGAVHGSRHQGGAKLPPGAPESQQGHADHESLPLRIPTASCCYRRRRRLLLLLLRITSLPP